MSRLLLTAGDQAIEVSDGVIVGLGRPAAMRRPGLAETPYGPGASILAPFHDHHFHPIGYAAAVTRLSIKEAVDFSDLGDRLREAAAALGPGAALVGNRLDEESLAESRLPARHDLDIMVSDRPLLLYRYCGHVAVANSAALELAGLGPHPTGILTETAIQPVAEAVAGLQPPLDPDDVRRALSGLPSLGLGRMTAIVSAGEPIWCGVPDEIGTLLAVAPDLPLDFEVLVIAGHPAELAAAAARLDGAAANVTFLGWKDFADGSLGGHTAALYDPYTDQTTTRGILRLDPEHAGIMSRTCLELGGSVAIHAIGDLANDRVLDLYELLIESGADPARLRIEHASVLTSAAIERMARLGVTASIQPAFLASEAGWLEKRLGARTRLAYPLAALAAAGVPMIGGSDCPVEPPDPRIGVAAAREPGGLEAQAAWRLFAADPRVGDRADLMVLDRDPLAARNGLGRHAPGVTAMYRGGSLVNLAGELPFR
ncbi:MAG TPA: amidohydrolase family protein [Acidimicrobiia bacterium]|nr:amidohydrolase family protein [Acidimicrobiia bacterium]